MNFMTKTIASHQGANDTLLLTFWGAAIVVHFYPHSGWTVGPKCDIIQWIYKIIITQASAWSLIWSLLKHSQELSGFPYRALIFNEWSLMLHSICNGERVVKEQQPVCMRLAFNIRFCKKTKASVYSAWNLWACFDYCCFLSGHNNMSVSLKNQTQVFFQEVVQLAEKQRQHKNIMTSESREQMSNGQRKYSAQPQLRDMCSSAITHNTSVFWYTFCSWLKDEGTCLTCARP